MKYNTLFAAKIRYRMILILSQIHSHYRDVIHDVYVVRTLLFTYNDVSVVRFFITDADEVTSSSSNEREQPFFNFPFEMLIVHLN